ncbi:hypothetical protein PC112_g7808 [Phytophthora cactorum]|nr:hypothetical protein PC112_g7808 [Phytophthora cactorum]
MQCSRATDEWAVALVKASAGEIFNGNDRKGHNDSHVAGCDDRNSPPKPRGSNKATKRFTKFQRSEALGQYSILFDSESVADGSEAMELDDMKCDPDFRGETDEADDAPYAFTNEDEAQVNKEEMDLEMKPIAAKTSEDRARRTFEDTIMVDTEDQGDTGMANTTNS